MRRGAESVIASVKFHSVYAVREYDRGQSSRKSNFEEKRLQREYR